MKTPIAWIKARLDAACPVAGKSSIVGSTNERTLFPAQRSDSGVPELQTLCASISAVIFFSESSLKIPSPHTSQKKPSSPGISTDAPPFDVRVSITSVLKFMVPCAPQVGQFAHALQSISPSFHVAPYPMGPSRCEILAYMNNPPRVWNFIIAPGLPLTQPFVRRPSDHSEPKPFIAISNSLDFVCLICQISK